MRAAPVVVPPHLAGPVRDLLVTSLWNLTKTNGGTVLPELRQLIEQLHQADQHHDQAATAAPGFADETPTAPAPTMEITADAMAQVMGCSRQYVRRLAAAGVLPARRIGRVWLITIEEDRAHVDEERG